MNMEPARSNAAGADIIPERTGSSLSLSPPSTGASSESGEV